MDDILIEELELGVRSYNCLKRAGIQTVGDLVPKSESELSAIPNFGKSRSTRSSRRCAPAASACARLAYTLPSDARVVMRHQRKRYQLSPRRRAPQGAAQNLCRR